MSTKTLFIITGAAAWIGGIATAMTAASCDVESCQSDPQPSAIVRFWAQDGSTQVPVQASAVKFQVHATDGIRHDDLAPTPAEPQLGVCMDVACTQWMIGSDQPGRIAITADVCGEHYAAETVVELDELGCHAQTEIIDVQVDARGCPVAPERIPPYECEPAAHPSVHVMVAKKYDDYFAAADVDMVWFEHEGKTHEARCLQGDDGKCMAWIAGYELEGPISVSTEYCDTVVSKTVTVEPLPSSCHVDTEYMILEVSTQGCLTDDLPAQPPPRPGAPWDLTTVRAPQPPTDRGPDDLSNGVRYPPDPDGPWALRPK
ncbi:MAG: hypothetical protein AB1Z98_07640 [Nannocystaceae bacterium]